MALCFKIKDTFMMKLFPVWFCSMPHSRTWMLILGMGDIDFSFEIKWRPLIARADFVLHRIAEKTRCTVSCKLRENNG